MTWTGLTYSFGSLLTSTKMTQNQANFSALAAGDAGAPHIVPAALDSHTAVTSYTHLAITETMSVGTTSNPGHVPLLRVYNYGQIRVAWGAQDGTEGAAYAGLAINSVFVSTTSYGPGAGLGMVTDTLNVSPFDLIQVYASGNTDVASVAITSGQTWVTRNLYPGSTYGVF